MQWYCESHWFSLQWSDDGTYHWNIKYKKYLKNETVAHIVKYMCTALSFQRSRLYIIRSYSVEKSFPIKSNIHCISRLCAAIPRCILPSHTTPEQAASWPEFSYNSSDARKLLDYCSKLEKWTSRKLLLGKSWPCDQAVKKEDKDITYYFSNAYNFSRAWITLKDLIRSYLIILY